jgi:hypothetical protein
MQWGEPSEAAAVHALRLMHSYPAHYAALAAGPIRARALELLAPTTTGAAMRTRLQLLFDCLTVVHSHDQQAATATSMCLSRVLGRRKQIGSEGEEGRGGGAINNSSSLFSAHPQQLRGVNAHSPAAIRALPLVDK